MNKEKRIISDYSKVFILLLVLIISPTINADVISLNSGGSNEIIINPDTYIEGFFSGEVITAAVCGNGILETGEECDDGNLINGDGCSSTCTIEEAPSGNGGVTPTMNIIVNPTEISLTLAVNTNKSNFVFTLNETRTALFPMIILPVKVPV